MGFGTELERPSTLSPASDELDITTKAIYEFTKYFLLAAKTQFDNLDGHGEQLQCISWIENFENGVAGEPRTTAKLTRSTNITDTLKAKIKKHTNNKKQRQIKTTTVNPHLSNSFKKTFNRVFIEIGYRIYTIYKQSFEYISSNSKSNKISKQNKIQAIHLLAEYAGSACFNSMVKYETLENPELSLTKEFLKEAAQSTLGFPLNSLKLYFWVSKNSNGVELKQMETSPYEFFVNYIRLFEYPENFKFRQSIFQRISWGKNKSIPVPVKTEFIEGSDFFSVGGSNQNKVLQLIIIQLGLDPSFCWEDAIWATLENIQKDLDILKAEADQFKISQFITELPINTIEDLEPISFQVSTFQPTFYGREKFLENLHREIKAKKENPRFVIFGIGGVGKTTVVQKYIELYYNNYDHVLWIDAQDCAVAQNQFRNLAATKLHIQLDTENTPPDFPQLREEIYERLCRYQARVLIVLDNADATSDMDAEQQTKTNGIQSLLPQSLPVSYVHPTILITSRQSKWDKDLFKTVNLDLWTEAECTDFVLNKLELPTTDENNATARELSNRFGRLPIAMQSALSIILQQLNRRKHESSVSYEIQDLIEDYDANSSKQGHCPKMSLWDVSFKKILGDPNGGLAIKILCFMAYLSPTAIPRDFLRSLFEDTNESDCLNKAFALLNDYSLITFFGTHYTIHRMIQEAVIQNLRLTVSPESNTSYISKSVLFTDATFSNENDVLANLSKQLHAYLSKMNEKDTLAVKNIDVINNCLHTTNHVLNNLSIPECSELTKRVANIMEETWNFDKAVEMYTKLIDSIDPATDADFKKILEIKDKLGSVLEGQGKFDEAHPVFSEILDVKIAMFGMNHHSTLETQTNIITTLLELERHDEASIKFNEVQEAIKNMTHPEDPAALTANYNFACLLYSYLEEYDDALELFEKVLEEYEKSSEPAQLGILRTQSMIADTLCKQEKHDEAVKRYCKVQKIAMEKLGPTNRDTLTYRNNYAYALYLQGKLKEALKVYEQVAKDEETLKESQYPNRSVTKHSIASVLTDLGEFDKAVEVLMNLLDVQMNDYGYNHHFTLDTMHYLAVTLRKQEKYEDSMEIYQLVLKGRLEKLGPFHSDTLMTKTNIGWAYFHNGEFQNAERIARDILSTKYDPVTGTGSPKFDYSEADELLSKSFAGLPLTTHFRRRIMSLSNLKYFGASDQSARDTNSKEKLKIRLEELYGFCRSTTKENFTEDDDGNNESEALC